MIAPAFAVLRLIVAEQHLDLGHCIHADGREGRVRAGWIVTYHAIHGLEPAAGLLRWARGSRIRGIVRTGRRPCKIPPARHQHVHLPVVEHGGALVADRLHGCRIR